MLAIGQVLVAPIQRYRIDSLLLITTEVEKFEAHSSQDLTQQLKRIFFPISAEYNGWWVQKKNRKFCVTYKGAICKCLNPKNIWSLGKKKIQTNQSRE